MAKLDARKLDHGDAVSDPEFVRSSKGVQAGGESPDVVIRGPSDSRLSAFTIIGWRCTVPDAGMRSRRSGISGRPRKPQPVISVGLPHVDW